ncbi:MAG TPA: hypothetical protein VGR37_24175 [Longimicrobiaceae bacterium]|nr:hypothetical protein [Longimicrobiaceae bacterium]
MSSSRGVALDQLRSVIAARMAAQSLRAVAREVGMSPSGLQKFVDGSIPYLSTRRKLERWFVREAARGEGEMDGGVALAAVSVLVRDLPLARRPRAVRQLVAELKAAYGAEEEPRPSWLDDLARDTGSGPE